MESDERGRPELESEAPETETNNENAGGRNTFPAKDEERVAEEASKSHRKGDGQTEAFNSKDILKAIEVVERDSLAIAQSYTSLFASLRSALSQVTSSSIDHMNCFSDAAGRLQECALDATTKGNRYINSCLRLNDEIKRIPDLAIKLMYFTLTHFPHILRNMGSKAYELRRAVDALDSAVNNTVRLP